jgi:FMN-dependent NADH-azoreductase
VTAATQAAPAAPPTRPLPAPPPAQAPLAPPQPRALLLSGSPRSGGNTDTVVAAIAAVLEERGIPTTTVRLCDIQLNPCTGCELCRKTGTCSRFDDGMNALYPEIERSAGLVLASPTYNYTVTPQVKSFIDRLYPYFDFAEPRPGPYRARLAGQGRTLLPVGICEQNDPADMRYTIPVMRDAMEAIGYRIVDELALTGHFYRGTVATDEAARARITASAGRLAEAIAPSAEGLSSREPPSSAPPR